MKRWAKERSFPASSKGRALTMAVSAIAGLLVALSAPAAHADEGAAEGHLLRSTRATDEGPNTVRLWYGYQTLGADALSTSLFFMGAASLEICISAFGTPTHSCHNEVAELLLLAGTAGYALGGPSIHVAHGRWDKAGYSLALRVVPLASAIGMGEMFGAGDGAPVLVGGAALTAMVLDSALLGYETVAVDAPKVSLAPAYDPQRRSGSLVFMRAF
jgi:hypothetical protein